MQILCEITDWETTTATRGRGVGNSITSRKVIAFDNWNMTIALQRKNEIPNGKENLFGERFFPSMKLLLPYLYQEYGNSPFVFNSTIDRIINSLNSKTGKKFVKDENMDWKDIGKKLDDFFGLSYGKEYPPTVLKRIFKVEEKDTVEA